VEVAGKTGTAERGTTINGVTSVEDQSWYAAMAPYPDPEVVVVATLERGGFGADSAAPAVREILADYFDVKPGQVDDVSATTAVYE
jgi:penicillin-binding protein 2